MIEKNPALKYLPFFPVEINEKSTKKPKFMKSDFLVDFSFIFTGKNGRYFNAGFFSIMDSLIDASYNEEIGMIFILA